MVAYYNEIDPYAAQWLRNLIAAGHIADGYVDERSISDVRPADLAGFTQCHFFAGIGVWSHALRLGGWKDDRPIWTGSCPCQPFSAAGKGDGFADERHLWPHWEWLIRECRPPIVAGEQVASKDADPWIDLVHADMEALGYAFGCVPFPAAGIGAPHIRDRNYWMADASGARAGRDAGALSGEEGQERGRSSHSPVPLLDPCGLADAGCSLLQHQQRLGDDRGAPTTAQGEARQLERCWAGDRDSGADDGRFTSPTNGLWRDADWLFCRDGKWRPVEPGTFPLAHGVASRVGRLRAYGNAIVAEAAQAFITSYLECERSAALDNNCLLIGHNGGPSWDFDDLLG